jgi:hypothetical protein
MSKVSRARKYQIRNHALGLCIGCGRDPGEHMWKGKMVKYHRCESCREKQNALKRKEMML